MRLVWLVLCLAGCASAPDKPIQADLHQPEAVSGSAEKPGWVSHKFAVAAANPLAADAGYRILQAGGSAVDAAIAVQMVLSLVEPQSSGIGGGAFLLHHDGHTTEAFDGRETAPAGVDENLLMKNGNPLPFYEAVVGGRSVGVPGTVRMLEMAHRQHGKLPWATLFEPAITLAKGGFKVSPRLHALVKTDRYLQTDPGAKAYFYTPDGQAQPAGFKLRNPALADVLQRIASHGSVALHEGPIAQAIVDKVQQHPTHPGQLTMADMASYAPKKRLPLCTDYTAATGKAYLVCGFPPPSSGGIAIAQILGILNSTDAAAVSTKLLGQRGLIDCIASPCPHTVDDVIASIATERQPPAAARTAIETERFLQPDWLHLYLEASRLAFADRAQYVADPDYVSAPGGDWANLVQPHYLAERAKLIGPHSMHSALPGNPGGPKSSYGMGTEQLEYGTSHISIMDGYGNALSMTSTVEDAFGARQMVSPLPHNSAGGFLLNNQLTDFNFAPNDATGRPSANRVQAGKRPRSSMSPTLVLDRLTGKVVISAGSAGGPVIIHYTAKTLYAMLNWGLDAQQAINLPNFAVISPAHGAPIALEENRFNSATLEALKAKGHTVRELSMTSGLQVITRKPYGFFGAADPRREGVMMGD